MRRRLFYWVTILLLGGVSLASAQSVRGRVLDENGVPISFATMRLLVPQDSTVINGGVSDANGSFEVDRKGVSLPLLLKGSYMGMEDVYHTIAKESEIELRMHPLTSQLEEVTITAHRPSHTLVNGGISTTIEGTTLAQLPNIYRMLAQLPMVEVQNEGITVLGRGTPLIYINGRKMTDATELQRLSPHLIEKIDVVTTPDARYSASSRAVILITVRREPGSGLSGIVRGDAETYLRKQEKVALGDYLLADLNYRVGKWDILASVSQRNSFFVKDMKADFLGRADGNEWHNRSTLTYEEQHNRIRSSLGLSYTDALNSAGVKYKGTWEPLSREVLSTELYSLRNSGPEEKLCNRDHQRTFPHLSHRANAYYIRKLGSWELSADGDFYSSSYKGEGVVVEGKSFDQIDHTHVSKKGATNQAWGVRSEVRGPLWGGTSSLGMEYSRTKRGDTYQAAAELNLPSNNTQIKEQQFAFYLGHSRLIADKVQCSLGLRLEQVESDYSSQGKRVPELSRRYFNLFPNFSLATRLWGMNVQLAFNSRIERPQYWQLRSDYSYISRFEYQTGEPNLRPGLTYATEFTLNRKWITFLLSHQYLKHSIQQVTTRMPDIQEEGKYRPFTTLLTTINEQPFHGMQAMLILSPKIGFWSPFYTIGVLKQFGFYRYDFEERVALSKPCLHIALKNNFSLPYDILLGANFEFMGFGDIENASFEKPQIRSSLELGKQWLGGKLSTNLYLSDPIRNEHYRMVSRYSRLLISNFYSPEIFFSVSYRFNTTKSNYRGRGALDREVSRMSR